MERSEFAWRRQPSLLWNGVRREALPPKLFLQQIRNPLPFRAFHSYIIRDESRLRVIACWRSPVNPARPWVLYAAQNEQDVVGINGVFHGPAQFTVAQGTTVLENGY